MTSLVLGANTTIDSSPCKVVVQCGHSQHSTLQFGQQLGLMWLPLNERRKAVASPAYLHETKDWATLNVEGTQPCWILDLDEVFDNVARYKGVHYLQLIVYAYQADESNLPAVEVDDIHLTINNTTSYHFSSHERHMKMAIVLEIYRRHGTFKCRALGETSGQGFENLAKRVDISLDARPPSTHARLQEAEDTLQNHLPNNGGRSPRHVTAGETWTGTAFAIDPYHLLTCYHVIESASLLGIRQSGESDREVSVVMSDIGSDSAILKVNEPMPSYLSLAVNYDDMLGETITTLGYPLSGINSQLQVTQGCISAVSGFNDDIRFMQFTAPIQPGSSGSPLLLPSGEVVGMVTATLTEAQNMNYAVKYQLLSALLSSAGIRLSHLESHASTTPLTTPQLSRQYRHALWLVGAQA